jgi:adenosylcobalamin-dependent ribonucleoside-diphosphate reductase
MAVAENRLGIGIRRYFTEEGKHPYDQVKWERRDSRISDFRTGAVAFEQLGVEVPATWSMNATNILAQKYFRGTLGTPERETSLRQVIDRVVDSITAWGIKDGYFIDAEEAAAFSDELKHLIVEQKAAFNSPVWFNIGVKGVPQQASACFILAVEDSMKSILNWYVEEGTIFKGGSGSGVNLSRIRASKELLEGGGTASGPVSFMRGADASAGTIKSGGKTRRAAKMVILDSDHPDIQEFIWCKAKEERKARVLAQAGFDMDLDGADSHSIQYQNANNSVRVTDGFMRAVLDDADWDLTARTDGAVIETVKARDLFRQIAQAAWECADPGLQYDTTINKWHTAPNTGRITASNPCSEYVHLDNSSCNLASLNLLRFLDEGGTFDVSGYKHACEVVFTAQEILVGNADYPTEKIGDTTRKFRQLGLGYANLGALLMSEGVPYDSEQGRAWAGALTALMTGAAYETSAKIASRMGPFAGFHENAEPMVNVLRMHREAVAGIDEELVPTDMLSAAQEAWDSAVELAEQFGVRNAQATVLAPTGTISFLMDCDTTGIEPDLGLVKTKKLVGGGTMSIVNQTVPRALRKLGYDAKQVGEIVAHIDEHKTIVGAPHLSSEHLPVFACSMGDNVIYYLGHVKMMAAAQPFISGAISKCVVGDTIVTTENGLVRIGTLYEGEAPDSFRDETMLVASLGGAQKTNAFYYGGERPVRRVVLRSGQTVTGTPNHRVLVAGATGLEWRRLDEIEVGEAVATKYGADMWSPVPAGLRGFAQQGGPDSQEIVSIPEEMTEDLAFFLGAYAAKGCTLRSAWAVRITNSLDSVLESIAATAERVFGVTAKIERPQDRPASVVISCKTVVELLECLGCGEEASAMRIPQAVLASPRPMVLAFLRGLSLGADVSVPDHEWSLRAASPALLDDVQAVLTNLGIVHSRVAKVDSTNGRTGEEVCATGTSAQALIREVPFLEPEKSVRAQQLSEVVFADGVAPIPGAEMPSWVSQVLEDDLQFSAVTEVGDAGLREVFDISVPSTQAFLGNGIVNHNTVNMPEQVTVEEVEQLHIDAWRMGLKAIAIYRDNCKVAQPLSMTKKEGAVVGINAEAASEQLLAELETLTARHSAKESELVARIADLEAALQHSHVNGPAATSRTRLPRRRRSNTFAFRVADCKGYVTVGEYEDGRPGEVFMKVSKQGSTLSGVMDAFSISVSLGLQHGVPLSTFVQKYTNMRFEPAGITDDQELRLASSLVDYIFRRLALDYLSFDERLELGVLSTNERTQPTLPGLEDLEAQDADKADRERYGPGGDAGSRTAQASPAPPAMPAVSMESRDAPFCYACGNVMQRAGSCYACPSCGATSGCS